MALQNLAWVSVLFGDALNARMTLAEASPLCSTPALHWHQRIGEAFLASIDFEAPDHGSRTLRQRRSLELAEVIYSHEGNDLPAEVRSHAYWLAGRISLEMGEIESAFHFGQQAIQHAFATPVADARCLYDAADLLRQVYRVRSQVKQTGS